MAKDSVISEPTVTLNIIRSRGLTGLTEQKVLFIGQKTSDGSAASGALVESVQQAGDIEARFGQRSLITQMMRAARTVNEVTQFDAISLDDAGAGMAATATITFAGVATENGTFTFEIASAKNQTFSIDILTGDTAAATATALQALLAVDTKSPWTSAEATSVVTFTAANAGTIANDFLIRSTGTVAGLIATLGAWSGGATDPVVTTVFNPISDERYQTIVYPGEFNITELTDLLDPRFNATNKIMDGVGIVTITDTLANVKTAAEAANSQSVVMFGNKPVADADYIGSHMRELNDVMSAQFGAARALRLTDGANLANVVVTTQGPRDQFGGIALASLPYFNTPFPGLPVPITGTFWTVLERSDLEDSGASAIGPNKSRQGVIAAEIFTTNTTDGTGNPDTSFKFLNTVDTSSAGREFQFNNIKKRFVQSRLTLGDLIDGRSMENEASVRAFIFSLYDFLSNSVPIYQKGNAAVKAFSDTLVVAVTLTAGEGLVDITQTPPLVGQLRDITGTLQINFGSEA